MPSIRISVSVVALLATLASIGWLSRLQADGPKRVDLDLEGGIPATLYLPVAASEPDSVTPERPPAVVLAHGIASDRAGMSVLARTLTQAGYAVLSFDFRGHGANRNPFRRARGARDSLYADVRTAVDFLRAYDEVDGARVSVMGHSMGAGAVLDYAASDPALDASVMISGGWRLPGPHRPSNALFIYGAGDPDRIRERSAHIAAEIVGVSRLDPGSVGGSFRDGTAVSHVKVARADHITILTSQYAARSIIDWLDQTYGVERGTFFLRADPRLTAAMVGLLSLLLVLPGLGDAVGRLAPKLAVRPGAGSAGRLGLLAAGLLATLPLVSVGEPARLLPLAIGDTVVLHLFAAGMAVLAWLVLAGRFDTSALRIRPGASAGAAFLGFVAVYLLLTPFGVVLHSLGPTPERAGLALGTAVLVAPFLLVFHDLLRRGGTLPSVLWCVAGRLLVLAVLALAVSVGVLPGVVMLMLPVLAILMLFFEVVSSAVYHRSRNTVVVAALESVWLAWIFAAVLPVEL